jgi:hypothetical protein
MEFNQGFISVVVALGGTFASLVAAWALVKFTQKAHAEKLAELLAKTRAAWEAIEVMRNDLTLLKQRVDVHGDLLKPDKLAEHYTKTATFETETHERMTGLRRDVDELRKKS